MKRDAEVNKGLFFAVIAVVVVVVCFLGYRFMFPGRASAPDSVRQKYMERMKNTPPPYPGGPQPGGMQQGGAGR